MDIKYIINTTYIVMPAMHGAWHKFMLEKFIPYVEESELYCKTRFTRLLSSEVEKHFTYSLQIECAELEAYHNYMKNTLQEYLEFSQQLFDSEATHFVSLLKVIK